MHHKLTKIFCCKFIRQFEIFSCDVTECCKLNKNNDATSRSPADEKSLESLQSKDRGQVAINLELLQRALKIFRMLLDKHRDLETLRPK